jgi:hypothetical protein
VQLQKKHIHDLNKDVTKYSTELKNTKDLDKILTIQNQLNYLQGSNNLHNKKPVVSRLFNYLTQITPAQISIAKLDVSFTDSTMHISGAADSIAIINTYVDTLKFTKYTVGDDTNSTNAFSAVVLSGFGRDDRGASYEINLKFDPVIFDNQKETKLAVPQQITTRSEVEKPADLFQPNSDSTKKQ